MVCGVVVEGSVYRNATTRVCQLGAVPNKGICLQVSLRQQAQG